MSNAYIDSLDHNTLRLVHTACLEYQLKLLRSANRVHDTNASMNLRAHVRKLGSVVEVIEKRLETLETDELKRVHKHPVDSAESLFSYIPSS
jgi:hypothetical protein